MPNKLLNIIAIGYAKRALEEGSREQERMLSYARELQAYHLIVFTRTSERLPEFVQKENLFIYGTHSSTKLGMLFTAIKLGRTILKNKNQKFVVASQDPFETSLVGYAISLGSTATNQVQIHGDVFNPLSCGASLIQRVRKVFGIWAVKRAAVVRVVSDRIKNSLLTLGVKEESIIVLPIQSSLSSFYQAGENRQYDENSAVSFLYVGRFSPEKNLPLLLRAFTQVVAVHPQCTLTLVGEGKEKAALEQYVQATALESNVTFLPWTQDVVTHMTTKDVFCLTSNHEGWAMVLLEAAASGMGIVTTDVGCAGEVLVDKRNALVTPVADEQAYIQAMLWCAENFAGRKELQLQARQTAKNFIETESQYLEKLVDSYTS